MGITAIVGLCLLTSLLIRVTRPPLEASMRYHGRTDLLQKEIVMGLRQAGAKVAITSSLGNGFPDLLVKYRGVLHLLEVKTKGNKLTDEETLFFSDWCDVTTVIYTLEDALRVIGVI